MNKNISVIIPALNEEKTIRQVIEIARMSTFVNEIIVVDDKSTDNTAKVALESGAVVITGTMLGKGSSMLDGLKISKNEILVYLDSDVTTYLPNTVDLLAAPILEDRADFVKSVFDRKAGRVTELVAKPLLSILFPSLVEFSQPLSGMIAVKRKYLEQAVFENDYGVDVGLLIDIHQLDARIIEVNIGAIEHKMKSWHQLPKMSQDVARAILKRVREPIKDLPQIGGIYLSPNNLPHLQGEAKLAIFDMDNTLLNGRFIYQAAETLKFSEELSNIVNQKLEPFIATKRIATLLKGISVFQLKSIADSIELVNDAKETVIELKKSGYMVGIISDSYNIISEHIKEKVGADFSIANELEVINGVATGEVRIPSSFLRNYHSFCTHNVCKTNAMLSIASDFGITVGNCIAIGDSETDVCMVEKAGLGISFCSSNENLDNAADFWISKREFKSLIDIVKSVEQSRIMI